MAASAAAGAFAPTDRACSPPDAIAAHFDEISDISTGKALQGAFEQTQKYVAQAAKRAGIKL